MSFPRRDRALMNRAKFNAAAIRWWMSNVPGVPSRRRDRAVDHAVDLTRRFAQRRMHGTSWVELLATPQRLAVGAAAR